MARNVKPAPLHLTPETTAKLLGDWPGYGSSIVRVPLLDQPLVDRPKGGERG